jgi:hypothetical protein
MPKAFENCVKNGGDVRTAKGPSKRFKLKKGQYRRYCYSGGKLFLGEAKEKR